MPGARVVWPAVALMLASMAAAQETAPVYMFDPAERLPLDRPVILEGILQEGVFLGAPAYGSEPRTDAKERWPYVQLPYPVRFVRDPMQDTSQTAEDCPLYFVQLMLLEQRGRRPELLGRMVRVKGRAMWGHTSHHRTPVVLLVDSVERIQSFGALKK